MRIEGYLEKELDLNYPISMDGENYYKVIIREVGGRDEEALSKEEDYKKNEVLSLSFIITRCIAEVVGAKRLPTMDEVGILPYNVLESIGIEIRRLTLGNVFKALGVCPSCGKTVEYEIRSEDFMVNSDIDNKDKTVVMRRGIVRNGVSYKNCKIRPFNIFSMVELRKLTEDEFNNPERNTQLLFTLVKDFDGIEPTIEDIKDLTKADRKTLFENITIPSIVKPSIPYSCHACKKDIDLRVWVFDFL